MGMNRLDEMDLDINSLKPEPGEMPDVIDAVVREVIDTEMPTDDMIDQWKAIYGKVYEIEVMGNYYIYRGITRGEIRAIKGETQRRLAMDTRITQEEAIDMMTELMQDMEVRTCTLWPDLSRIDFNDSSSPMSLGGVIPSLATAIDEASGFDTRAVPREL